MKPKCCIFTSHPVYDRRVFHREAMSLKKFGFDVTIIGRGDGQPRVQQGIRVIPLAPYPRAGGYLDIFRYVRRLRKVALAEPNVTVYHTDDFHQMLSAIKIMRLSGKPAILDVHEMYPRGYARRAPWGIGQGLLRWFVERFENWCAKRIKNVMVVYDQERERFEKLGCRVVYVDNFATKNDYPAEPVSQELWAQRQGTIVHTGLLVPVRGSQIIVTLAERLKKQDRPAKMLLTETFSTTKQKQAFDTLLQGADTEGVLEMVPYIPPNELPEFINRSMVGLAVLNPIGSLQHAMPTKLFEYMACSVPIVASRWPTTEKLVEAVGCGIVVKDNHNVDEYYQAILRILSDKKLAQEMGEAGRQAFLNEFNWEAHEPQMKEFYDQILRTQTSQTT